MKRHKIASYTVLEKRALATAGRLGLKGLGMVGNFISPSGAAKMLTSRTGIALGGAMFGAPYLLDKFNNAKADYMQKRYEDRLNGKKHSGIGSALRGAYAIGSSTAKAVPYGIVQHFNHLPQQFLDYTVNGIPFLQNIGAMGINAVAGEGTVKEWKPWMNTENWTFTRPFTGPVQHTENEGMYQ